MIKTIEGKRFLDVKVGDDGTPKFEEIDEKAFSWLEENELSYKIWNNKYRYQGESFDEHCNRVTGGDEYMKNLYIQHKFSYGGRTLSNRGTNRGSISNCYSLGFIPDSLDGILEYGKDMGLTYKSQGGQGCSLSHIRPKGTMIGKDYESDGIVPFMEIFNSITSSVSQGGSRKGALLMSMDVWHKQIDDFITIKSKEGKIEKANLSVEIDDDFMKYIEQYRKTGENPVVHIERDYNGHKVEYDVKPVEVFKKICQFAKDTAEPGIIFTNRFRNYNIMEYCDDYQIETCNPCLSGDTLIKIDVNGVLNDITIKKLYDTYKMFPKDVENMKIYTFNTETKDYELENIQNILLTRKNANLIEIELENGNTIKLTPDHKVYTENRGYVKASELKDDDVLIEFC